MASPKEAGPAFIRGIIPIPIRLAGVMDQAGAITVLDTVVPGFWLSFEKMLYLPDVDHAGAGGTQTFTLKKGGDTGTTIDTITIPLATAVLGGAGIASTGVTAALDATARLKPTDGFSLVKSAGGTVFSTASGTLLLFYRTRPQSRG